jgi:hypothetical protein
MTPEGIVKNRLVMFLRALKPAPYFFFPQTGGYGRSGVPDVVGCWKGQFFAIECKAEGKAKQTTALQKLEIEKIKQGGGIAFVYDGLMSDLEFMDLLEGKK